ncbi:MAG: PhnD/SsuA/transferrin family substrate-binding protein [Anaerolineales bacterium]|nr:PhnD/SsuA/transferrin family substrate-binding protein [Anaerolineales bacterium]
MAVAGFEDLADLLYAETGLVIQPLVAADYAYVVEAMCREPPEVHMASLATFSYILASERDCAKVALVSVRYGSPS